MALKIMHGAKSHLSLLIQSHSGSPLSLRLNVRKMYLLGFLLSTVYLTTFSGSLLFFREVEINRKLEERVLELEMREKLSKMLPAPVENVSRQITETDNPELLVDKNALADTATGIKAHIGGLNVECVTGRCGVKLDIVPLASGTAQGQLLVILETEIPRIGSRNPTTEIRKRYFVYPGGKARDELDQADIISLERKNFRFSRALQTSAEFRIGTLLRPIAVNVYLYDSARNLIQHERKVIEASE